MTNPMPLFSGFCSEKAAKILWQVDFFIKKELIKVS